MYFQPFTFDDFGKDESHLGFNFNKGNTVLARRNRDFRQEFSHYRPKMDEAWTPDLVADFLTGLSAEKSWQVLQHLGDNREDLTDDFDRFQHLDALGDYFSPALDLAVNAALYNLERGYTTGHTILLEHSQDRRSVLFNLTTPDFQRRLVNGALWEIAGETGREAKLLEKLLTDFVGSLDPAYHPEGFRILDKGLSIYHAPFLGGAGLPVEGLSSKAIRNLGVFAEAVIEESRDAISDKQTLAFAHCFAKPYFRAVGAYEDGEKRFTEEERAVLTQPLSHLHSVLEVIPKE